MTREPATPTPPKKRSALKWPLLASLAVNLFLGGILIGHTYSEGLSHFFRHQRVAPYMMQDLSPQSRAIAKDVFKAHSGRIHELWRELRQLRQDLQRQMNSEPFDETAVRASFTEMRRLDGLIQTEFHNATVEIARKLPADERSKLNLRWKREHRSGRDRGPAGMVPPGHMSQPSP